MVISSQPSFWRYVERKWKYNLRFSHLYAFWSKFHIECLITTYIQAFSHLSSNLMTISFKFWHEVPNQKFIFQMTSGDIWPFLTHFLLRNYPIEQISLPENCQFLMHTFLSTNFYSLFFNGWKKSRTFVNLKFVSRSFIQWTDCTFQNKTNYCFFLHSEFNVSLL